MAGFVLCPLTELPELLLNLLNVRSGRQLQVCIVIAILAHCDRGLGMPREEEGLELVVAGPKSHQDGY